MISILQRAGFSAHSPVGPSTPWPNSLAGILTADDYSIARWLPANLGSPLSPGQLLRYKKKVEGKKTVRFALRKGRTLDAAEARLCS